MDGDCYGKGGKRNLKNLVGVLFVVFACSLFIGVLVSRNSRRLAAGTSQKNIRHTVAAESSRHYAPVNSDLFNTSKRRTPSGADPIHNSGGIVHSRVLAVSQVPWRFLAYEDR